MGRPNRGYLRCLSKRIDISTKIKYTNLLHKEVYILMSEAEANNIDSRPLPVLVKSLGGGVVEVFSWPQHQELTTAQRVQVGLVLSDIIRVNPEIADSTDEIDKVLDAASHFQINLNRSHTDLITEFGIDNFYLAVQYLHESGQYGFMDDSKQVADEYNNDLSRLLVLTRELTVRGVDVDSVIKLHDAIRILGGFEEALELNGAYLDSALSGLKEPSPLVIPEDEE